MRRELLLIFFCGLFTSQPPGFVLAQSSAEQAELEACRQNLRLLHEAFQAYRRANKDLPMQLSDLVPKFLAESSQLVCPAARRLGITSEEAARSSDPAESLTTYTCEFRPTSIPAIISGGSSRSMRDWKELQMGLVGSEVPVVRCLTHESAVLNLSFGGRIYESGLDWEINFDEMVDPHELYQRRR